MSAKPFALKKEERLCSRKIIETIFEEGKLVALHPFKILWICNPSESNPTVQVAFAVSKRNFKQAVKRNLVKRRVREAYRKNKALLYEPLREKKISCSLIFIYFHNEILNYREIETLLVKAIQKLLPAIEKGDKRITD